MQIVIDPDWEVERRMLALRAVAMWAKKPLSDAAFAQWRLLIKLQLRWRLAWIDGNRRPLVVDSVELAL